MFNIVEAELWKVDKLEVKPRRAWKEAVVRWFSEMQNKKIDEVTKIREAEGVKPASVNRMLAFIRAVLRKAANEWEWIDRVPIIRLRKEENKRIRWITREQAAELLETLPAHLSAMANFSLATGLRQSNVTGLKWQDVDLIKRHALIHPDQAKAKKAIPVPLNADAISVLRKQLGLHNEFVFTYQGKYITQVSTKAWRKALKKTGINNFRWHDLRHTWASWHVQNGTTLQELQVLGGWSSFEMVLRYAHLSSDHLKSAAERISMLKVG